MTQFEGGLYIYIYYIYIYVICIYIYMCVCVFIICRYYIYITYTLHIHYIYIAHSLHIHCTFIPYTLHIHYLYITYTSHIHYILVWPRPYPMWPADCKRSCRSCELWRCARCPPQAMAIAVANRFPTMGGSWGENIWTMHETWRFILVW